MKPEERLVSRMLTIYGEPKTDDPVAYMNEVERAVSCYSAEILERAATQAFRRFKFWPRPAEICEVAEAIAAQITAEEERRNPKPRDPDLPPPSPEEVARSRQVLAAAVAAMSRPDKRGALPRVTRDAFEAMQRNSPNRHLHVDHAALARRITGERND